MTTLTGKFSRLAAGLNRTGYVTGKIMGRTVSEVGAGLSYFSHLAQGKTSEALKMAGTAVAVAFTKGARLATKPLQQDARELADQARKSSVAAFAAAVKGGYKEGRQAPTLAAKLARQKPGLKPA